MCGSTNNATRQAERNERERQAQQSASINAINAAFAGRQKDYDDFERAYRTFYTGKLDNQQEKANRELVFAMARGGLTGGSADVDANRLAAKAYQDGILQITGKAASAAGDLRRQDQAEKNNLISLAQAGMDATTAGNNALLSLQGTIDQAKSSIGMDTLGDMFAGLAPIYQQSQTNKGRKDANNTGFTGLYGAPLPVTQPAANQAQQEPFFIFPN